MMTILLSLCFRSFFCLWCQQFSFLFFSFYDSSNESTVVQQFFISFSPSMRLVLKLNHSSFQTNIFRHNTFLRLTLKTILSIFRYAAVSQSLFFIKLIFISVNRSMLDILPWSKPLFTRNLWHCFCSLCPILKGRLRKTGNYFLRLYFLQPYFILPRKGNRKFAPFFSPLLEMNSFDFLSKRIWP